MQSRQTANSYLVPTSGTGRLATPGLRPSCHIGLTAGVTRSIRGRLSNLAGGSGKAILHKSAY